VNFALGCWHTSDLSTLSAGLTPEMVATVCKIMRNQDLIAVAHRCRVVTRFSNTIGLPLDGFPPYCNRITPPATHAALLPVF